MNNMNVLDDIKTLRLNGVDFKWRFSMLSLYKMFQEFGFESESEIFESLSKGNIITILQLFYVGILWDTNNINFESFLMFLNTIENKDDISDFLSINLEDFLYPKKDEDKKKE